MPVLDASVKSHWHTIDLREPVKSASPLVSNGSADYRLGRFLYRFPDKDGEWEVIEFPEGVTPVGMNSYTGLIQYEKDGHIFTYDGMSHSWKDLDTRKILEGEDFKLNDLPKPKE